jgi:hypothetical protein
MALKMISTPAVIIKAPRWGALIVIRPGNS